MWTVAANVVDRGGEEGEAGGRWTSYSKVGGGAVGMRLLYISGAGRSGSSLLDLILGMTRGISSGGEVHRLSIDPDRRLCSCNDRISECRRWESIRKEVERTTGREIANWSAWPVSRQIDGRVAQGKKWRLSLRLLAGLGWGRSQIGREYQALLTRSWYVYQAISSVEGSQVVIDSTKDPLRLAGLARLRPGEVKAVYLTRDGRGVVSSQVHRGRASWMGGTARWVDRQIRTQAVLAGILREDSLTVTYEDVCSEPLREVNRIRKFLGLQEVSSLSRLDAVSHHLVPGNPALQGGMGRIALDERWRECMSRRDELTFEAIGGLMNRRLGYNGRALVGRKAVSRRQGDG